jgi:hypothetical protein
MTSINDVSNDIILRIFNDFLSFKEIIYLRLLNKNICHVLESREIWEIINLTDINTVDKKQIIINFQKDNNFYLYLLSGKKRDDCCFSMPMSLKKKMIHTKLLII